MVVIKREMSLVERSSVGGGNFWGLVQQKGPWKTTKHDIVNAKASFIQEKVSGGGIGEGGTIHAGHGNFKQVINPAAVEGRDAPPKPSSLAMRSIIFKESNHYRKKAVAGMLPQYETLGERNAIDVGGHKAGGVGSGEISFEEELEKMSTTPIQMPSASFLTEHRLEEQVKEEEGIRSIPSFPFIGKRPPGVVRKPRQKVRLNPYEKVLPKEKTKPESLMKEIKSLGKKEERKRKLEIEDESTRKKAKTDTLKRKAEIGGEGARKKTKTDTLKRKAETGGEGTRKKTKAPSKLTITTTNLPPPVQRFQGGAGRKEKKSLPKTSDKLPLPRTRGQVARAA